MSSSTDRVPDKILGLEIADRLIAAALIEPTRRESLAKALAAGTMTSEDWRVLLEGRILDHDTDQAK